MQLNVIAIDSMTQQIDQALRFPNLVCEDEDTDSEEEEEVNPCIEWLVRNYKISDDGKHMISPTSFREQFQTDTKTKINKDRFAGYLKELGIHSVKTHNGVRAYKVFERKS